MLPQIVIAKEKRVITEFINDFVKKNQISPFVRFTFAKEKTAITIEQIREINTLAITLTGVKPLFIIHDFQTAQTAAQNAFLKTLEETTEQAYFILIVSDGSMVLETIRSRSRIVGLKVAKKLPNDQAITLDSLGQMLSKYSGFERRRDKAIAVCDRFLSHFQDELHQGKSVSHLLREILEVRRRIEKNNVNPQLGIDHLIFQMS